MRAAPDSNSDRRLHWTQSKPRPFGRAADSQRRYIAGRGMARPMQCIYKGFSIDDFECNMTVSVAHVWCHQLKAVRSQGCKDLFIGL